MIVILNTRNPVTVIDHSNPKKYPAQKFYVLEINGYLHLVPFEKTGNTIVLKTIYPSRKMTKLYQQHLSKEENS